MLEIDDKIFFDSDDEFYNFAVVPELVTVEEIGVDGKPFRYTDFNFSDIYKDAVSQGKKFIIKNEDSKITRQNCVSYRTITKKLHNMKPYFDDIYDYVDEIPVKEGLKINANSKIRRIDHVPLTREDLVKAINEEYLKQKDEEVIDFNNIDVSRVKDFSQVFANINGAYMSLTTSVRDKNFDVSNWNMSSAMNTSLMFANQKKFNCDLSKWNVKNVTYMNDMFNGCEEFNSDLSKWDVSRVKDMTRMFFNCKKFNQDLSKWNVSHVKDMDYIFYGCSELNQDFSNWDVKNNCIRPFSKCPKMDEKYMFN